MFSFRVRSPGLANISLLALSTKFLPGATVRQGISCYISHIFQTLPSFPLGSHKFITSFILLTSD